MSLIDLYVKDRHTGLVHKVGTNKHDSLWVDSYGTVYYQNLQNGDGCGSASKTDKEAGYEFIPSDCGMKESEDDCPMCGHHMLQPGPDGYLFCVECGRFSKDGIAVPTEVLIEKGIIKATTTICDVKPFVSPTPQKLLKGRLKMILRLFDTAQDYAGDIAYEKPREDIQGRLGRAEVSLREALETLKKCYPELEEE